MHHNMSHEMQRVCIVRAPPQYIAALARIMSMRLRTRVQRGSRLTHKRACPS